MEQRINAKRNHSKRNLLLLFLLNVIIIALFLFLGITEKNFDFYMPKRLVKIIAVIIVSYSIGYSSVAFQTITNNHILTPSVMGLDSLYLFIQTVVVFFFGSKQLSMMTGYPNFLISVAIMVLAAISLFLLLFRGERKNVYFLVLTGMIFGGLFNGLATFMQVLLDPNEFSVLEGKMFASFNNVNTDLILVSALTAFAVLLISIKDIPYLDVLSLGPDHAINLGVDYKGLVLKTLIISAVLISVSTALVGPITFLGILVVNLGRQIMNTYHHRELTLAATFLGVLFLTFGLLITERVFQFSTTVSVIINFIGGIYFLYLMLKESKR
jgi:iron complex transport system permease protein